ncbi:uncharacterized protein ASCRUDRAFT_77485 [Ascoidea rubescens DSM 1968]|uniref:Rho-GAP domain-containing protein n=1 Tax=Ascoidea rubescens DSM 1968 TaxID=1344418 RepID=A0A1D2VBV1_9ASCO|nr:hypothetical protein ASCRUDRAFT_77485 [Ascoidea rubescens DSM 1968]ODV59091.1 hypothetical protein ASCRUDRAFT_77485 [Ascoidea rubescens DSM 1968]
MKSLKSSKILDPPFGSSLEKAFEMNRSRFYVIEAPYLIDSANKDTITTIGLKLPSIVISLVNYFLNNNVTESFNVFIDHGSEYSLQFLVNLFRNYPDRALKLHNEYKLPKSIFRTDPSNQTNLIIQKNQTNQINQLPQFQNDPNITYQNVLNHNNPISNVKLLRKHPQTNPENSNQNYDKKLSRHTYFEDKSPTNNFNIKRFSLPTASINKKFSLSFKNNNWNRKSYTPYNNNGNKNEDNNDINNNNISKISHNNTTIISNATADYNNHNHSNDKSQILSNVNKDFLNQNDPRRRNKEIKRWAADDNLIEYFITNNVASDVLKHYLSCLPEPLISDQQFKKFCDILVKKCPFFLSFLGESSIHSNISIIFSVSDHNFSIQSENSSKIKAEIKLILDELIDFTLKDVSQYSAYQLHLMIYLINFFSLFSEIDSYQEVFRKTKVNSSIISKTFGPYFFQLKRTTTYQTANEALFLRLLIDNSGYFIYNLSINDKKYKTDKMILHELKSDVYFQIFPNSKFNNQNKKFPNNTVKSNEKYIDNKSERIGQNYPIVDNFVSIPTNTFSKELSKTISKDLNEAEHQVSKTENLSEKFNKEEIVTSDPVQSQSDTVSKNIESKIVDSDANQVKVNNNINKENSSKANNSKLENIESKKPDLDLINPPLMQSRPIQSPPVQSPPVQAPLAQHTLFQPQLTRNLVNLPQMPQVGIIHQPNKNGLSSNEITNNQKVNQKEVFDQLPYNVPKLMVQNNSPQTFPNKIISEQITRPELAKPKPMQPMHFPSESMEQKPTNFQDQTFQKSPSNKTFEKQALPFKPISQISNSLSLSIKPNIKPIEIPNSESEITNTSPWSSQTSQSRTSFELKKFLTFSKSEKKNSQQSPSLEKYSLIKNNLDNSNTKKTRKSPHPFRKLFKSSKSEPPLVEESTSLTIYPEKIKAKTSSTSNELESKNLYKNWTQKILVSEQQHENQNGDNKFLEPVKIEILEANITGNGVFFKDFVNSYKELEEQINYEIKRGEDKRNNKDNDSEENSKMIGKTTLPFSINKTSLEKKEPLVRKKPILITKDEDDMVLALDENPIIPRTETINALAPFISRGNAQHKRINRTPLAKISTISPVSESVEEVENEDLIENSKNILKENVNKNNNNINIQSDLALSDNEKDINRESENKLKNISEIHSFDLKIRTNQGNTPKKDFSGLPASYLKPLPLFPPEKIGKEKEEKKKENDFNKNEVSELPSNDKIKLDLSSHHTAQDNNIKNKTIQENKENQMGQLDQLDQLDLSIIRNSTLKCNENELEEFLQKSKNLLPDKCYIQDPTLIRDASWSISYPEPDPNHIPLKTQKSLRRKPPQ